jgi:NitT/TauT family transport system permease protein
MREAPRIPPIVRIVVPIAVGLVFLAVWEWGVRFFAVSKFVLPTPSAIATALVEDYASLGASVWNTLRVTLEAFVAALILGVLFAVLFAQSRLFEISLFPYAVILQVTPVVSIAPLILIWVGFDHIDRALVILATIVAFFPILSNTTVGLKSADHNLRNLFDLYRATRWQRLIELELPSALPISWSA